MSNLKKIISEFPTEAVYLTPDALRSAVSANGWMDQADADTLDRFYDLYTDDGILCEMSPFSVDYIVNQIVRFSSAADEASATEAVMAALAGEEDL